MKKLAFIGVLCILVLGFVKLVAAGTAAGQFTIGNEAPQAPSFEGSEVGIQDNDISLCPNGGGTNYDNTNNDTHMNATYTPALNWTEGFDPNNDSVTTKFCVSTAPLSTITDENANTLCDVANNWSNATAVFNPPFEFNDSTDLLRHNTTGNGTTFYVALQSVDNGSGNLASAITFYEFYLNNTPPSQPAEFNLSGSNHTHLQDPGLNWTNSTDPNDGNSDSNCPADVITYNIQIGDSASGGTERVERREFTSSNYTFQPGDTYLDWGVNETDGYRNETYYVRIYAYDGVLNSTVYDDSFILSDYLPNITQVYISNDGTAPSSCTDSSCTVTPAAGSNSSLGLTVNFLDLDQDCEQANNISATLYLCYNTTATEQECSAAINNLSYTLDNIVRQGDYCNASLTANISTTGLSPEFFRPPLNYLYKVNISSQAGSRNDTYDERNNGTWRFNSLVNANYTAAVTLGGGAPTLGQWNDGTDGYNMTNLGNVKFNVTWNTSDPTTGTETWFLNGSDLMIDDDADQADDDIGIGIPMVGLNATPNSFNMSTSFEVCQNALCNLLIINETLETYYHIYPPTGLAAGTYTNTIEYTTFS